MSTIDRYQRVLSEARRLRSEGVVFEGALAQLRAVSQSPIDSIKAGRDAFGLSLGEAKIILHRSDTWSDCRDSFDDLHETAEKVADELWPDSK